MKYALPFVALLLAACASSPTSTDSTIEYSNTMDIIVAAAEAAPQAVGGTYVLPVVASGRGGEGVYLNTELDYRDQRAVTINLSPQAAQQLEQRHGEPADTFFIGKAIRIRGHAGRVQILMGTETCPSDKYYYQTHILVSDARQIQVLSDSI